MRNLVESAQAQRKTTFEKEVKEEWLLITMF
jgi:hypothetical protein